MPGISQWRNLMPWTVTIEGCSTMDAYGSRTYQSCTSVRAAIQGPAEFLHATSNQMRVSRQTIICGSAAAVSVLDRITLPASFEIRQPPILQVEPHSDGSGMHHCTIYLG